MSKVKTLDESVKEIASTLEDKVRSRLQEEEDELLGWVEKHGLGRSEPPETVVATQAVYNVLLKSVLYGIHPETEGLPALTPQNYENMIKKAEEVTDEPGFERYTLDEVAAGLPEDELGHILELRGSFADGNPSEGVGNVYEQTVPVPERRRLGQFRTPPSIADLMTEWVTQSSEDEVLDPGVGAGVLSAYAYRKKKSIGDDANISQVHGVDVSELSVLMANVSLRLEESDKRPDIRLRDFLKLSTDELGKVDAVVSNPPYTRHHELDEEYKKEINEQAEKKTGTVISALSPLYLYFYVHANEFLRDGGRMSFITPSEFLETGYGGNLRRFLLDEFRVHALVLYDRDESVFDEAMATSCVTFLEKGEPEDDDVTKFVSVEEDVSKERIIEAVENGKEGITDWGYINVVPQEEIEPEEDWDAFFDPTETEVDEKLVSLSEIADISRGIATGNNDFFCLSENEKTGSRNGHGWEIDEKHLSKLVRNSGSVPHYCYTEEDWERQLDNGDEVWLLYHLNEWEWNLKDTGIWRYLEYGKDEMEAHQSYLAENRDPWYLVDRRKPAPVLYTYMSRGRSRFILNETAFGDDEGARNLNNLLCIYPDDELSKKQVKALLAYLNSDFADVLLRRNGRTYSTGMDKIEPSELGDVPVLDPQTLRLEMTGILAEAFDSLCEASRSGDVKGVIGEIDEILKDEIDLS